MNSRCACHGLETVLRPPRCPLTGHRQPVNGVAPRQTRELAKRRPWFAVTELAGRRQARKALTEGDPA